MASPNQIKDYFLGQLSELEQLQLEEEFFTDSAALPALWADFNDLIDDYLNGKMSSQEHRKFEERLHQLPALQEKVKTDRALLQALGALPTAMTNQSNQRANSTRRWALSKWWSELSFPVAVTAVLVLGLAGGAVWYSFLPKKVQPIKQEMVNKELPMPPLVTPALTPVSSPQPSILQPSSRRSVQPSGKNQPAPVVASFLLSAEIIRSNDAPITLSIAADVTTLRLELELKSEVSKSFRVSLQDEDGKIIKTWNSPLVISQQSASVVIINLLAASLIGTDYVIKLTNVTPPQEFHFRLQKTAR